MKVKTNIKACFNPQPDPPGRRKPKKGDIRGRERF